MVSSTLADIESFTTKMREVTTVLVLPHMIYLGDLNFDGDGSIQCGYARNSCPSVSWFCGGNDQL